MAISTVSINNTPQAKGDEYYKSEDDLSGIYCFDVMWNDLGGNAKILWSLDNTAADGSADLIASDIGDNICNTDDTSLNGAKIWIENGKVRYDTNSLSTAFRNSIDALGAGESTTDSFTYAIRMANGTLSWTTATIVYQGRNDGVVIGSGDFAGAVTEDGGTYTDSGSFAFDDVDSTDAHTVDFTPQGDGYLGTFSACLNHDSTGAGAGQVDWKFTVDNEAVQFLGEGETLTQTYSITVDDGEGGAATKTVTVIVTGNNDVAEIGAGTVAGAITEDSGDYQETGTFAFTDVDLIDGHIAMVTPDGDDYVGALTAEITDDSTGDGSGEVGWSFTVENDDIQYLGVGDSLVQTYTVTVDDDEGGAATQTVTVTIYGTNDDPEITIKTGDSAAESLTETNDVIGISGTLTVTDPDTSDTVAVKVVGVTADGDTNGMSANTLRDMLSLDDASLAADDGSAGNLGWTFSSGAANAFDYLGGGEVLTLTYAVEATDDEGVTASHDVVITITGTNDAAELSSATEALTETDSADDISTSGTLTISDVDSPEEFIAQTDEQGTYGTFSINAAGEWTYVADNAHNEFVAGEVYSDTFDVVSADGTSTTVTINITGTNDAAEIAGDDAGSVTEAGGVANETPGVPTVTGDLDANDVDSLAAFNAQTNVETDYGRFSIDADGAWSYTLDDDNADVQALNMDSTPLTDSITVTTADGTTHVIAIAINGANDVADISGDTTGSVAEDASPNTATGNLDAVDVDNAADEWNAVASPGATVNGYGTFTMTAAGAWTYTLDNGNAAVNALVGSATLSDSFTALTADGTSQTVTVTITATNDIAEITVADDGDHETTEAGGVGNDLAGDPDASGQVIVTDPDAGQAAFQTPSAAALNGSWGDFAFDPATGQWTYTLQDDGFTNILNDNDVVEDYLTVRSLDGTASYDIVVTIHGTNDVPYVTGEFTGSVTEEGEDGLGWDEASGLVLSADVDNDDEWQDEYDPQPSDNGYGTFTIGNLGGWNYHLDNTHADVQALNDGGSMTDTFTVYTTDGTPQQITITIYGDNDAAFIEGDDVGMVAEAGVDEPGLPQATGTLTSDDVDNPDNAFTPSSGDASYGTFEIDADGNWIYQLDNTLPAVNDLDEGEVLLDDFTVSSVDGTTHTVTIKIDGANDVAPLTANRDVIVVSTNTGNPLAPIFIPIDWLLANDVDADGDLLTVTSMGAMTAVPGGWSFAPVLSASGAVIGFNVSTGNGTDVSLDIGYTITDGDGNESMVVSTIRTPTTGNQSTPGVNTITLNGIEYNYSYIDGQGQGDTIVGGTSEPEALEGTVGNDFFLGSAGNDTLDARGGDNWLTGGDGNDDFVFRNVGGTNHITDFNAGTATNTAQAAADQLRFEVGLGSGEFSIGNNDAVVNLRQITAGSTNVGGTEVVVNNGFALVDDFQVQTFIDSHTNISTGAVFVVVNSALGNAAVYYDPNPSVAGGAVLITEIDNITTAAALTNLNGGDFLFP